MTLLPWIVRAIAVLLGAYLGYVLGFFGAYYLGDRDVGSAFLILFIAPITILMCSLVAFFIANAALSRWQ